MVRKVNDSHVVNMDLTNTIDNIVSVNPQLNSRIDDAFNKTNLFICEVLRFYPVNDKALVKILNTGEKVSCYLTHDILSSTVSLESMVDGSVATDNKLSSYIVPHSTIYGVVALVRNKGLNEDYCLISCLNLSNDFSLKSNVDAGEIKLVAGDSSISVDKDRVNILCPELFVNGLPFSEPEFDNIHTVDEINDIIENIPAVNAYTKEESRALLKAYFSGHVVDVKVEDGQLKVIRWEDGDFHVDEDIPLDTDVLKTLQKKLTAGDNIIIDENNVISAVGGGSGTNNYNSLINKPKINNVELNGDKSLSDLGINFNEYTKTVDLNSLISSYGYLKTHQSLENYYTKTETNTQINNHHDNTKQNVINDLAEIRNNANSALQSEDNISELVNDVGYLTSHQSLANYYTKSEVDDSLSGKVDSEELDDYTKTNQLDSLIATYGYLKTHQSLENYYVKSEVDSKLNDKQDKLTAGLNITIDENNVISAVGGATSQVQSDYAQTDSTKVDYIKNKPDLDAIIEEKVKSMLNSYFDGKCANVRVEDGELVVDEWEDGDFQ